MIRVRDLGRLRYAAGLSFQRRCRDDLLAGRDGEVLLLVEHPAVLTVGRSGGEQDLGLSVEDWRERGVDVVFSDRGGKATWHGAGQVVAYPVVDLRLRGRDVRAYVHALEDAGVAAVARFGAAARPGRDPVGVFVGTAKIASVGVSVSRWVTQHGLALNVVNDLGVFRHFTPCGLAGVSMTRLADVATVPVSFEGAKRALAEELRARLET